MEHLMGESVEKRRPIPRRIVGDSVHPAEYELGMYFDFFKMFVFSSSRCILLDGKTRNRIFEGQSCLISISRIPFTSLSCFRANKEPNRKRRERERGSWLQLETLMFSRRGDPILYISRDIVERFYLADEIGNVRCSIACALNNIGC